MYTPDYPTVTVANEYMTDGAAGFRVVPVTGGADTATVTTDASTGSDDEGNTAFIETYDWVVPNSTCTPTTMLCPIPNTWAHIDYTTPSSTPEPAEGQCAQQKSGTSDLAGCDAAENGRWAGNCGDASSYFWFEKIACGSTRTFHTDGRSLIEDSIVLSPTWENIRDILAEYYTTKAPLRGETDSVGFTFINADYHVAPVLPPKVECSCLAAMDAYASLLSVQSKTPTPGAPVTLDPEVLNTGSSKIVATLRMYHDPTYSLSAEEDSTMPIVVSRFY
jgi:hypothetical protein